MNINGDTIVTLVSLVESIPSFSPYKIWEIRHDNCIGRNTGEVKMQNKRLWTQLSSKPQMLLFRVLVVFVYDGKEAQQNAYCTCSTNECAPHVNQERVIHENE